MKSFELKGLGLEEMSGSELFIEGGGLRDTLKRIARDSVVVAIWDFVNEHWDALVEGLEEGCEEGAEKFGCN